MHYIITFGFSVPIRSDISTTQNEVNKKTLRDINKKKGKSTTDLLEPQKNIIHTGEILAEIHVEYEILPNYNFKFDCRCWETAAKIYTENNDWCLRPIPCSINKNTCWILFSVHHIVPLNEIQIKNLFKYVTTCHIFLGKQKFSERAKRDKVKAFYIDEESINIGEDKFLQIYPLNLHKSKSFEKPSNLPNPQSILITDEIYGDYNIITHLDVLPDSIHEQKFRKMLKKDRFPCDSLKCEMLITLNETEEKPVTKKAKEQLQKSDQSKKTKKGKREETTKKIEVHLPAEAFFSEMGVITSYNRTPHLNISSILIYAQCHNILSNKQLRMAMNPISIKLEQLSNLPVDTVIDNNIKRIYAKIYFVNRIITTPCYTPGTVMCFEFIKCFLYDEFEPGELINFLATKFLIVEIIGIRISNIMETLPSAHEQNSDASKTLKSSLSPYTFPNEEVLLGIAEFDVSDLLKGLWEVKLTSSLIHPRNIYRTNTDSTNDNGIKVPWGKSPLSTDILMLTCTSVKIKIRLAYDLRRLQLNLLRSKNALNRIFLNLSDLKVANAILKGVSSHNSNVLNTCQFSDANINIQGQNMLKHIITGFAVESSRRIYIFFEGLSNGYLSKIWQDVTKLTVMHKCIYYNSDYIFPARLYEDFIPLGGIVHIKLSETLEEKLRACKFYIGQTRTTLEAVAIRKIGLVNLTLTMKSLCQGELFPAPNDVKAFICNIQKIHAINAAQIINT